MTLADLARLANKELLRLGVLYHSRDNREGLVCRGEPGRKPPALRMGCEWFTAVYAAEGLLDLLRRLRLPPGEREQRAYWQSGVFWHDLKEANLEMLEAVPR